MIDYIDIIKVIFVAFTTTVILGPIIIPMLTKLKVGQNVRDDGPETHLVKSGTPTMGGIIMMIALLITVVISGQLNSDMYILLLSTFGFGLIGFIDDYFKVVNKRSLGLRAYQKLLAQIVLASLLAIYQSNMSVLGSKIIIPFLSNRYLDLGMMYIPFIVFVVVGTVNSVNLTDGLDGLATGITLVVMSFFGIVAFKWGIDSVSIFSLALTGACLGFLIYNAYPAKIFMGDTGSMALGGAVAAAAIMLNLPLMLPIVGGIYVIESLSVIIQVISYKLRGKRVFLMSPLHHHFEEKGWPETKVVIIFWSVTIILALIGSMSLN